MREALKGKRKEWAKVIARAWADEEFKRDLLADPRATLKAEGIEFPENIKINISEATGPENSRLEVSEAGENEFNLTLPAKPPDLDGSVEELCERVQASACGLCNI